MSKSKNSFFVESFKTITAAQWNDLLPKLIGNRQSCTFNNIQYYSNLFNTKNISFIIKDAEKKIVGIIPLGLCIGKKKTFSFGGSPCPSPLYLKSFNQSQKRNFLIFVKDYILQLSKKYKTKKYFVEKHPICFNKNEFPFITSENQFEFNFWYSKQIVHNTFILDLSLTKDHLIKNLSKYHRRNILRSKKKNLSIKIFDGSTAKLLVKKIFKKFKKAHFDSAGKKTRPDATWRNMEQQLSNNNAKLFVIYLDDKIEISYLYCGIYNGFAWGWSQVNIDKYEKEFMPRHLLEWEAICYFKESNYRYYELGERYYKQYNFRPTKKELTISDFKEKYGSSMYPKVVYEINL
jgi:hypothetical protein